jgi:hypothetical protein
VIGCKDTWDENVREVMREWVRLGIYAICSIMEYTNEKYDFPHSVV